MGKATVRDWMHRGVFVCRPDTPASEVAEAMAARDISALVVVDDRGHALGVISETDLAAAAPKQGQRPRWQGLVAADLMSSPVISVRADAPVEEAARLIREQKIRRVVVTEPEGDRERPVGILSVSDMLRHMAGEREGDGEGGASAGES